MPLGKLLIQTRWLTLVFLVVFGSSFAVKGSGDEKPDDDSVPIRFKTLVHGKTELFSYLVSQPVYDGTYGHDGTCEIVIVLRNIGAKYISRLEDLNVTAQDQRKRTIKTIFINRPASLGYGDLVTWQIRLLPGDAWPEFVTQNFKSSDDAFVKFDLSIPKFSLLRNLK